jgi:RNA polymerase sigma factor (sigma-70 family)
MTKGSGILLHHVRCVLAAPLAGLSDDDLLRKFAAGGADSEPSFEVLVRRHGPMVLSTCRSAMGDVHAADDCFQAAFLVLVSAGRGLRLRGPLGPWLFQVARRVCGRARLAEARRARHESRAATRGPIVGDLDRDMVALIHTEVGHLPSVLRTAVVLCDLGGLSYQEAADRLSLPHATVRGRLAHARERLRQRLAERGIGPGVVWGTPVMVPAALVGATARAALVMAGRAIGEVPVPILELVSGGIQSMFVIKLKAIGFSVVTAGVLIAGAVGLSAQQPSAARDRTTPASAVEFVITAADDHDAGDDVAALVRRAQRQQDRGDVAGARKTLKQIQEGLTRWGRVLDEQANRAPAQAADLAGSLTGVFGNRAAGSMAQPSGVEKRVDYLERKLDRVTQELESREGTRGNPQRR